MKHRKVPRLVKVQTILDSEDRKVILWNGAENTTSIKECVNDCSIDIRKNVDDCSIDIRKNVDDNTALLQKDLVTSTNRLESLIEKVLYLSIISLVISTITFCIC